MLLLIVVGLFNGTTLIARNPQPQRIQHSDSDSVTGSPGLSGSTGSRNIPRLAAALPKRQMTVHNQNNMQLSLSNTAAVGFTTWWWSTKVRDPFSGDRIATVHYPKGSDIRYQMNATLLLGAIVGYDTLVSMGIQSQGMSTFPSEFYPDAGPVGDFRYRSIDYNHPRYDTDANSQLDIICEYLDTFPVYSWSDRRQHIPLNVKITQKSMVWTGDNIDDFVLFDFEIQNIGKKDLKEAYVGFIADGGVNYVGDFDHTVSQLDDVVGFLATYPAPEGCDLIDTLNIAYQMDNDGDPLGATWQYYSPRGAVGMRFVGIPSDNWDVHFNWSSSRLQSYSPRLRPTVDKPYRDNLPHLTERVNDAHMYYYLANPEVDYDQLFVTRPQEGRGFIARPDRAHEYAVQTRPRYLISAGPFDLEAGQTKTVAMTIVGGTNVHVNPWDYSWNYKNGRYPQRYYETLDFSQLAINARWAGWIYDNPGVDTDGDGYAGEFRECDGDTFWYRGDGIPDLKADGPPQSPILRAIASDHKLIIRWNGFYTETLRDPFTNFRDFEGYRVYIGLDDRRSSLSLLSVYDRENYDRFRWVTLPDGSHRWTNEGIPFTLDSLRWMYRNPEFDPNIYTRLNPLRLQDTLYYFAPHSYNASSLCCLDNIHKVYPNATDPGEDLSLWTEDDVIYDYGEPLPKYYEYEYIHDDLLPTLPYWISVTAYDFGFAGGNIPSKEADPLNNLVMEMAQTPADTVEKYELDAFVYPNPWRWDGHYSQSGYENRDGTGIPAREHRIHFSNLPRVCKISIYSLDGDLVRELDHNYPEGGPGSMHDSWDMITRNTQAIESGLYYYVIESEGRKQLGKFAIIK